MPRSLQLENRTAPISAEEILTVEDLAARLRLPPGWIYEKCRKGGNHGQAPFPRIKCGRYLRFVWSDVCRWLRDNSV